MACQRRRPGWVGSALASRRPIRPGSTSLRPSRRTSLPRRVDFRDFMSRGMAETRLSRCLLIPSSSGRRLLTGGGVWVDPSNEDSVWVAGVPLLHSTNGGLAWVEAPRVHSDQQALLWDRKVDGRLYLG